MDDQTEFFYRFECFNLISGNKTSGYLVQVSTSVLRKLRGISVSNDESAKLLEQMRGRLERAELVVGDQLKQVGFAFCDHSACPLMFTTNPMFGASLGADPEELARLALAMESECEWLGPAVAYTPHNIDTPQQAMALMVMVETWGEWAYGKMLLLSMEQAKAAA